jgi:hypothetical protein
MKQVLLLTGLVALVVLVGSGPSTLGAAVGLDHV